MDSYTNKHGFILLTTSYTPSQMPLSTNPVPGPSTNKNIDLTEKKRSGGVDEDGLEDGRLRIKKKQRTGLRKDGWNEKEVMRMLRTYMEYKKNEEDESRQSQVDNRLFHTEVLSILSPFSSGTKILPQGSYIDRPTGTFIEVFPDPDVCFSPRCRYGFWGQGYLTRLPWISDKDRSEMNTIPHVISNSSY